MMKAIPGWLKVAVLVVAAVVGLPACDGGPPAVVEVLEGTADGAGVILTFDVVVEGALPKGTPLEGFGLGVSVLARDMSTGLGSWDRAIDDMGFAFDNATVGDPGPFICDESTCRARLHGFLAGVPGDALEYTISVDYIPDGYGSSPPDFRIDLVRVRETPVSELFYSVPVEEGNELVGAVVQVAVQPPAADPPLGWVGVQSGAVWRPSGRSPAFSCLADGCGQASEVVFANDLGGSARPGHRIRIEGWLAAETDPVLTITDEIDRDSAVTETAVAVVGEYLVTMEYSSRDTQLPLMVNLEWAGNEFDQFFIDDEYAANRLVATAILADRCLSTSCSFQVRRTPNPSLDDHPPSELIVTVVPWKSETNPEILISITD